MPVAVGSARALLSGFLLLGCSGVDAFLQEGRKLRGEVAVDAETDNIKEDTEALLDVGTQGDGIWQNCAIEGDAIDTPGLVRFGWDMSWVEATLPAGATCSLASFDDTDPVPNIRKICQCAGGSNIGSNKRNDLGISFTRCASEGEDCACSTGSVRFGEGGEWVVSDGPPAGGHITCDRGVAPGYDPAPNKRKECWCEQKHAPLRKEKVAIILLSRNPPDLRMWLWYHLDYMGVEHVFMQVEDTPTFTKAWDALPQRFQKRVSVWRPESASASSDRRPQDDYQTLQARQVKAMHRAREESLNMGIGWLIHIDDDELLYAPLHRPIGEILAALPKDFDQAYIPNAEAVYNPEVKSCFTETKTLNMNRYTFVSYANGKAAARMSSHELMPAGPHQWRTPQGVEPRSVHMESEPFGPPLIVAHFESCPFNRWEDKFWELGNTSPEKVGSIPFPFYKESLRRMQECRNSEGTDNGPGSDCSQTALHSLWAHWKTAASPRLRSQDLMPIHIPWPSSIPN